MMAQADAIHIGVPLEKFRMADDEQGIVGAKNHKNVDGNPKVSVRSQISRKFFEVCR